MEQSFLQKSCEWFTTIKSPDLLEKVNKTLEMVQNKEPLSHNDKKLLGFILFDYSMHYGPSSFLDAEASANETGVTEEMKYYANDWVAYSKKKRGPTGLVIFLLFVSSLISGCLFKREYKEDYDKLCIIGQTYHLCGYKWDEDDPFEEQETADVIITHKKDGYVQYVRTYDVNNPNRVYFSRSYKRFIDLTRNCK